MRTPTKLLEKLANSFWDMRSRFKSDVLNLSDEKYINFDYPDYYGLPKNISSRLSGDFVDTLQSDLFWELENYGLSAYKKLFKSRRVLHQNIVKMWWVYAN